MSKSSLRVVFDYIDPGSYLVHESFANADNDRGLSERVEWIPLELRPPSLPPLDPRDATWMEMCEALAGMAKESEIPFRIPTLLPRSRKAHELAFMGREKGCFAQVHGALFHAFFREGRDIGRVDVLMELGWEAGLDPAEVRTVLGVDRHLPRVIEKRDEALSLGVKGVPTLLAGERRLEGFHGSGALTSFLTSVGAGAGRDEGPDS